MMSFLNLKCEDLIYSKRETQQVRVLISTVTPRGRIKCVRNFKLQCVQQGGMFIVGINWGRAKIILQQFELFLRQDFLANPDVLFMTVVILFAVMHSFEYL